MNRVGYIFSIAIFIKNTKQEGLGWVFYQDVYGLRGNKYDYLDKNDIKTIKWIELTDNKPYHFFVKKDFSLQSDYDRFVPIPKIFNRFSSGVKTHRDHFVVGFTMDEIIQRMRIPQDN